MYSTILVEFLEECSFGADHKGLEYNRDGDYTRTDGKFFSVPFSV